MVFKGLFRPDPYQEAARELYGHIVAQARQPGFYHGGGVPDSIDGRFELIVLHVFLVLNRLKREENGASELSQAVFDLLFLDMDRSLREMGVGDIGVGKRIKAMVQAFYGRMSAYDTALLSDDEALQDALKRNLFGTVDADSLDLSAFCGYVRCEVASLEEQPLDSLLKGSVTFGSVPPFRA